jgi:hypothetical protein
MLQTAVVGGVLQAFAVHISQWMVCRTSDGQMHLPLLHPDETGVD